MSIQLVERQRYTDDEGDEVIEYETVTERNHRKLLETLQRLQIEIIQRPIASRPLGSQLDDTIRHAELVGPWKQERLPERCQ